MIYIKRFNPFLMYYLCATGTFVLYWMYNTQVDLGLTSIRHIWYLRGIGITLIIGIIWEMFGIKEKEKGK